MCGWLVRNSPALPGQPEIARSAWSISIANLEAEDPHRRSVAHALNALLRYGIDRDHGSQLIPHADATQALANQVKEWRAGLEPLVQRILQLNADRGAHARPRIDADGNVRPPLFTISDVPDRVARVEALAGILGSIADTLRQQLYDPEVDVTGHSKHVLHEVVAELDAGGFTLREISGLIDDGHSDDDSSRKKLDRLRKYLPAVDD